MSYVLIRYYIIKYSLISVFTTNQPPALVLPSLLFLPVVVCLEPELQRCVSVFTPLAVDIGLVVIIAL